MEFTSKYLNSLKHYIPSKHYPIQTHSKTSIPLLLHYLKPRYLSCRRVTCVIIFWARIGFFLSGWIDVLYGNLLVYGGAKY